MRLSPDEIAAIKDAARAAFGTDAVVRLFGSRTDDTKRGGDIDLHVEVDAGCDVNAAVPRFEDVLFRRLDEQRIDMVVSVRGRSQGPFERIGYRDGIVL